MLAGCKGAPSSGTGSTGGTTTSTTTSTTTGTLAVNGACGSAHGTTVSSALRPICARPARRRRWPARARGHGVAPVLAAVLPRAALRPALRDHQLCQVLLAQTVACSWAKMRLSSVTPSTLRTPAPRAAPATSIRMSGACRARRGGFNFGSVSQINQWASTAGSRSATALRRPRHPAE